MRHAEFLRHHQVSSFFVLAFVYFWTWEGVLYVVFPNGFPGGLTQAPLPVLLYALLGATASGVTGIILMRVLDGRRGLSELADRLKRWRVDVKWYAAAIFTTAIATTATLMVLAATVSQKFLPTFLAGQNIVTLLPVAAIIGLIAGFVEEFGWTGFALPRLLARFPAICASLILGIIWSAWHIFPYFWGTPTPYTSLDIASALFFIGALIPYRILIAWIYINSRGSLLLAIIMHACYDASLIVLVPYASLSQLQSVQFYAGLNGALWVAAVGVTAIFGKRLTLAVSLRKTKVPSPSLAPLYEARAIVVSNKDIQDSWTSIGCDKEKLLGLLDTYSNKAMAHASLSVAVIFGIFGLLSYVSFERPLLDPMVVFIVALYVIIYFALCILAGILTLNFTYYSRVSEKMKLMIMRTRDLIEDYTAFRMAIKYTDLTNAFFPNDLSAYADIFVTSTTNYEWTIEERRRFFHRSFIHYKVGRISKLEELRPVYEKFRDQLIRRRHRPVLGHEKFGRFCLGYVVAIGFAIYLLVLKFMKL